MGSSTLSSSMRAVLALAKTQFHSHPYQSQEESATHKANQIIPFHLKLHIPKDLALTNTCNTRVTSISQPTRSGVENGSGEVHTGFSTHSLCLSSRINTEPRVTPCRHPLNSNTPSWKRCIGFQAARAS